MHEIITLQLGQRSNYLATHFWNLQESYFTYSAEEESPIDHDVHFRAGVGADGSDTYTPRTVIYDLKGGFGAIRKYNALYEIEDEPGIPRSLWDGNEVVQQQPPIAQNEYQKNLDLGLPLPQLTPGAVRYWSDFNRVFYHPRSIVQLSEYELNSKVMPFEDWFVGEDLFKSLDKDNDVLDRDFRPFAEECDQLQGIQIFSGIDDAWGGFAARYVDRLRDEFGKKSIWLFGLEEGAMSQRHKQAIAKANTARSMNDISPQTTAYIPIRDPPHHLPTYVSSELSSEWRSSALVSTAVESITLPTRLRSYRGVQSWLPEEDSSRKIFNLDSAVVSDERLRSETSSEPKEDLVPEDEDRDDKQLVEGFDLDFFGNHLSSATTKKIHVFGQVQVSRGFDEKANQSQSVSALQKFHSSLAFPVLDCFPQNLFTHEGAAGSTLRIRAALSTTSHIGDQIKELQKFAARAVSPDERETLYNGLGEISEAYQEWWESSSESEDD